MVENKIVWKQEGNKVYFMYKGTEIYFLMPKDYDLSKTHIDLLHLVEILLLSPFEGYKHLVDSYKPTFTRSFGKNNSLSFSTGVDSTAAMLLLPDDTILAYHKRDFESLLIHDNAMNMIKGVKEKENRDVIIVPSNHEKVRELNGLQVGFSTDYCCLIHLILLADYLDLKSISTGMVFDSAYMNKDSTFRDFNTFSYYLDYKDLFERCGLYIHYPVAGLSEYITSKIVGDSIYSNYAQSCLRGIGGCGNCYKCYRKNLLNGKVLPMNKETEKFTSTTPPKMVHSIVFAAQRTNVDIVGLREYMGIDFSFLERYYPDYLDLNNGDGEVLPYLLQSKLEKYGIEPMNDKDIETLKGSRVNRPKEL